MSPTHTETEQAITVAEQAAEAVRALNHLTRSPDTCADPADTHLLLAALATLTQRLPQLLHQVTSGLDNGPHPARLRVDDWAPIREPAALLAAVNSDLQGASHLAHRLSAALDSAQQSMAHLSVDTNRADDRTETTEQGVSFQPQPGGQYSAAVDSLLVVGESRPTVRALPATRRRDRWDGSGSSSSG